LRWSFDDPFLPVSLPASLPFILSFLGFVSNFPHRIMSCDVILDQKRRCTAGWGAKWQERETDFWSPTHFLQRSKGTTSTVDFTVT
jgi:hypothetical protein